MDIKKFILLICFFFSSSVADQLKKPTFKIFLIESGCQIRLSVKYLCAIERYDPSTLRMSINLLFSFHIQSRKNESKGRCLRIVSQSVFDIVFFDRFGQFIQKLFPDASGYGGLFRRDTH